MEYFFSGLFLFFWALCLAAVEVEVEGAYGWAEKLPTWFRKRGFLSSLYRPVLNGRPLTGYHMFMFFFPLFGFHWPFFHGVSWTMGHELQTLGDYALWTICWDWLWFVLNPAYGPKRFKQGRIWWYPGRWFFVPLDYYAAVGFSFGLAALSGLPDALLRHALHSGVFAVGLGGMYLAAPLYHRWYRLMRKEDDRELSNITPPPSEP